MALQTSGAITISDIKGELGSTSNSLRALSAAAGFSTPDAMSEFYGYSSFDPANFFNTKSYTGNGGTLNMNGVGFAPQVAITIDTNIYASGSLLFHQKDWGSFNGSFGFGINAFHSRNLPTFGTDGITVQQQDEYNYRINNSGATQHAVFFGDMTEYTIGGQTSLVNKAAGFGFFKLNAPSYSTQVQHHLDQKPHFLMFFGSNGFINAYYDDYQRSYYTDGHLTSYSWGSRTSSSYFYDNAAPQVYPYGATTGKYFNFPETSGLLEYVNKTEASTYSDGYYNFGFYAHPVDGFSNTGIVDFDIYNLDSQTVTLGYTPKMVIAIVLGNPFSAGEFTSTIWTNTMPSTAASSFIYGMGPSPGDKNAGLRIDPIANGFTIHNTYQNRIDQGYSNSYVQRVMYYACL